LDTQEFEWKNRKKIQTYQILTKFEYLIFWISKNLDKKLDKNLSKRHGRSYYKQKTLKFSTKNALKI